MADIDDLRSSPVTLAPTSSRMTTQEPFPKVCLMDPHLRRHTRAYDFSFQMTHLLRFLLRPLGQRIQGACTEGSKYGPPFPFPSILRRSPRSTHQEHLTEITSREVYASHVVPQTLKGSPPAWYWFGATTGLVRFVDTFGFRSAWVSWLSFAPGGGGGGVACSNFANCRSRR